MVFYPVLQKIFIDIFCQTGYNIYNIYFNRQQGRINMKTLTVSFFGHRELEVSDILFVEHKLEMIIARFIKENEYVEFLIGRDGMFDKIAASIIRKTVKKHDYGNSSLVLVLPYSTSEYRNNNDNLYKFYDEVEICEKSSECFFKVAIQVRNKSMIERSDLVICYIEKNSGGTYRSVKYAKSKGKSYLNLTENVINT